VKDFNNRREGNNRHSKQHMKKYLSLAVLLLSTVYSFAQTCEISGTVKSKLATLIYLFEIEDGEPKLISSVKRAEDGSFRFWFTPKYEGFYVLGGFTLLAGQHPLYLKKGDKAEVIIDDKRIEYLGQQSPENTVLAAWNSLTEGVKIKSVYYSSRPASIYKDFFPAFTTVAAQADSFRSTIKTKNARFNQLMKQVTYFDLDFYGLNFLATPRAEQPRQEDLLPWYKTIVVKDKFKNDDILLTPCGKKYLLLYADYAAPSKKTEDGIQYLSTNRQKGIYVFSKEAPALKTYVQFTQMMDKYGEYFQSTTLKASVEKLGLKLYNATVGLKGQFSFPDKDSNMVSLADFKGKWLLVDGLATWCGPCLALMPALKKLEEEMKEEDVAFVSVAVDGPKGRNTWLRMIREKQMGGTQLFAGGGNNSLTNDYAIKAMPRFLIFDRDGKLVTANAPGPGTPELKKILLQALATPPPATASIIPNSEVKNATSAQGGLL